MKTMSLKITDALYGDLTSLAADKGVSRAALVRQALMDFFRREKTAPPTTSALAMLDDLVGSVEGPEDLSHDPDQMDDFGR